MRVAITFLSLAFVSCASAYFEAGNTNTRDSALLLTHADYESFNGNNPKVFHFNTCKEYNVEIHKVEIMTHRGRTIEGRIINGGPGSFFVVVEVRGEVEANTEFKVWGKFNGQRRGIQVEKCFFIFDRYYPCAGQINRH